MAPEPAAALLAAGLFLLGCGGTDAPGRSAGRQEAEEGTRDVATAPLVRLAEESGSPMEADEPLLGRCRPELVRSLGDEESFGRVTRIRQLDSLLFVTDYRLPPHLKVVDAASGRVVRSYGRPGEGPGEFRTATAVFVRSRELPTVGVYDYQNRRVSYLRFEGPELRPRLADEIPITNDEMGLLGLTPYDSGFAAGGLFADFSLALIDREGRITEKLVTDPPFGPEDVGGSAGFAAIMNNVHFSSSESGRIALAYEEESIVDLVDLDARTYRRILGPEPVETRYAVREGRLHTEEGNERAYRFVAATDRLVFAGFLGGRVQDMPYGQWPHRVMVFDWAGRFLAELELGRGVTALGVSPDGTRLWGAYRDPYPRIGGWEVPEPILAAGAAGREDGSAPGEGDQVTDPARADGCGG